MLTNVAIAVHPTCLQDVGSEKEDGSHATKTHSGRTSTNSWCVEECYEDPIARNIMQRIEDITGIPEANSENLQLLRYEKTQFYQTHSDYIPYQRERPTGVRILTFYMYLNDVEEGGEYLKSMAMSSARTTNTFAKSYSSILFPSQVVPTFQTWTLP